MNWIFYNFFRDLRIKKNKIPGNNFKKRYKKIRKNIILRSLIREIFFTWISLKNSFYLNYK